MGSCASSIASAGISCLGLATGLCITSLFAPFWVTGESFLNRIADFFGSNADISVSYGLFLACSQPYDSNRDCNWLDFDGQQDWFKACMILWAAGTAILVLAAIAAFFICCESCKTPRYAAFITFSTLFAAILLVSCVITFGVKQGDRWDRDKLTYYDWGYYLAIVGAGFAAVSFLLFGCAIYCLRK